MSAADGTRAVRWAYEPNTPVCAGCRNFQKAHMTPATRNARAALVPARCVPGKFNVMHHGCCDHWVSHSGERLK